MVLSCCSCSFWWPCCPNTAYLEELKPLRSPSVARVAGSLILTFTLICGMLSFRLGYDTLFVSLLIVILLASSPKNDIQATTVPHEHLVQFDSRPAIIMLGVVTVVLAGVIGVQNYNENRVLVLSAEAGRDYTDVSSTENPVVYADAGTITFKEAILDDRSAVGLLGYNGVACVVPIVNQHLTASGERPVVRFWAVGKDCCKRRGDFACDSALDLDVRGGIVVQPPGEEALFAQKANYDQYLAAVAAATDLYGLDASSPPLLVRWVASPVDLLGQMTFHAEIVWGVASAMHALIFTAAYVLIKLHYEGHLDELNEAEFRKQAQAAYKDPGAARALGSYGSTAPGSNTRDVFLLNIAKGP